MLASKYELVTTTQYGVITVFNDTLCYVVTLTFDLLTGVMSRDATWVVDPCTKFELDTTYRSRVGTTTIFH